MLGLYAYHALCGNTCMFQVSPLGSLCTQHVHLLLVTCNNSEECDTPNAFYALMFYRGNTRDILDAQHKGPCFYTLDRSIYAKLRNETYYAGM
jgi:hypothetical protein